ncbi:hypothetical protein J4H86_10105 [Spiractinospora alimapuensis]|uniref:hypothetical protein n=1 Tax=Spiractinospora alimapuensis TaxID=2820884 RepID=UPI001F45F613|nr:hypothetical protein [Spiractinospora alimapuensis]QVQ54016.1 hypothetical protein J4H86_10105 [Spiractinospora alimapuensis]
MKTKLMPLHTTVANLSLVDHALVGASDHARVSHRGDSAGYGFAASDLPTHVCGWGRLDDTQILTVAETPLLALERLERVAGQRSRKQSAPIG